MSLLSDKCTSFFPWRKDFSFHALSIGKDAPNNLSFRGVFLTRSSQIAVDQKSSDMRETDKLVIQEASLSLAVRQEDAYPESLFINRDLC